MSSGFRGTVAEYQALYMEKNAHLEQFLEQVEPFDFYREIFPEGSFERKGHYEDSRPNGIAVSLPGKGGSVNGIALEIEGDGKAKRYIITDDLKKLDELTRTLPSWRRFRISVRAGRGSLPGSSMPGL